MTLCAMTSSSAIENRARNRSCGVHNAALQRGVATGATRAMQPLQHGGANAGAATSATPAMQPVQPARLDVGPANDEVPKSLPPTVAPSFAVKAGLHGYVGLHDLQRRVARFAMSGCTGCNFGFQWVAFSGCNGSQHRVAWVAFSGCMGCNVGLHGLQAYRNVYRHVYARVDTTVGVCAGRLEGAIVSGSTGA